MDRLFGFPIVKYKIKPFEYKKDQLTSTILHNYNIDKERNTWDTHSYLHQNIADEYNPKFKVPDCSSLEPIYLRMAQQYVKSLNLNNEVSIEIVNYTCTDKNNFMDPHIHGPADFVAAHYVSFDPAVHVPTVFHNPSEGNATYARLLKPELYKLIGKQKGSLNSWITPLFSYPQVEEDDVLFWPSILKHGIPKQPKKSEKKRISITFNVYLKYV